MGVGSLRGRLFALQGQDMEAQLTQIATQLGRFEGQLGDSNQRLLTQLGQARQLTGERRVEALAQVMQGMLQEQQTLMQYLMDLRGSITGLPEQQNGPTGTTGTAPATTVPPAR
jgi:predicted  nucleic acid-binding Zn-ribbon protein